MRTAEIVQPARRCPSTAGSTQHAYSVLKYVPPVAGDRSPSFFHRRPPTRHGLSGSFQQNKARIIIVLVGTTPGGFMRTPSIGYLLHMIRFPKEDRKSRTLDHGAGAVGSRADTSRYQASWMPHKTPRCCQWSLALMIARALPRRDRTVRKRAMRFSRSHASGAAAGG